MNMMKSLLPFILLIKAFCSDAKQNGAYDELENPEHSQRAPLQRSSKNFQVNKKDQVGSLRKILEVSPTTSPSISPKSNLTTSRPTSTSEYYEKDARIVGGVNAALGRYPYQVFLPWPGCGGTLIAPDYVLSAAHCSGPTEVQIGRHDLSNDEEEFETIAVELEIIHPDYCCETMDNDFMLLKLASPSSYDPIKLDDGTAILNDGKDVTPIGWGARNEGEPFLPDVLQEVTLDIVTNAACQNDYDYYYPVTENMVCASRSEKDSCQGDSGGPLLIKGESAGEDIQVGVTSWGIGCAREGLPGVYARVSTAYDWIFETMGSDNLALKVLKNRAKRAFTKMGHDLKHFNERK